jgi:hypothetical protein
VPTVAPSTTAPPAMASALRHDARSWHPRPTRASDDLDALVHQATQLYNSCTDWEELVPLLRGTCGDLHPQVGQLPHRAAHLLNRLRLSGAPVATSTSPWIPQRKLDALLRGPHQSAHQHIPFLRKDFVDMIHKGQWILLSASLVMDDPNLRLSHLGVVPQRDRRPRTISDYTYVWVNEDTIAVAPGECMQFSRALWRILKHAKHANPHMGPVYMSKIDIADGFYRIWVRAADVPKLGVLFPSRPGDEPLVGLHMTLPMGWKEAPKIFTAATETVPDLANQHLSIGTNQGDHRLDAASEQAPPTPDLPLYTPEGAKGGPASPPPGAPSHRHPLPSSRWSLGRICG